MKTIQSTRELTAPHIGVVLGALANLGILEHIDKGHPGDMAVQAVDLLCSGGVSEGAVERVLLTEINAAIERGDTLDLLPVRVLRRIHAHSGGGLLGNYRIRLSQNGAYLPDDQELGRGTSYLLHKTFEGGSADSWHTVA